MTVYQTTPARDAEFKDVERSNQRHCEITPLFNVGGGQQKLKIDLKLDDTEQDGCDKALFQSDATVIWLFLIEKTKIRATLFLLCLSHLAHSNLACWSVRWIIGFVGDF